MEIEKYIQDFINLKVNKNKKYGVAPHKPILLLSIIELIEKNYIDSNFIALTPQLIATFKDNWALLVDTQHQANASYPFFHLKTADFWHLKALPGYEKNLKVMNTPSTPNTLNQIISHAELDDDLFQFLRKPETRIMLQIALLDKFFPQKKSLFFGKHPEENSYLKQFEDKIIKESSASYQVQVEKMNEEDQIVRDYVFKITIPKIYNFTCAVSGLRVDSMFNMQMIDACHIIPFSKSKDDTIGNGFALCPNLHRAFDRGLIAIDDNYQVLVSSQFAESEATDYGIKKFAGRSIILPMDELFYPRIDNLRWHRECIFRY